MLTTSGFIVENELSYIFEDNNIMNFDPASNTVFVYDWECGVNNTEAGIAVCKSFKQLEHEFIELFISEMEIEGVLGTDFYTVTCDGTKGAVGPTGSPIETSSDQYEHLLHWAAPDACCGESPTWRSYNSGEKSCCGDKIYKKEEHDCCDSDEGDLAPIGQCERFSTTGFPKTDVIRTELPETELPETELPVTSSPGIEVSETVAPLTEIPETVEPETELSTTVIPETELTETEIPTTLAAETQNIGTNAPESTFSETLNPDTVQPETLKPETSKPATIEPSTQEPETEAPNTDIPETQTTEASETVVSTTMAPTTQIDTITNDNGLKPLQPVSQNPPTFLPTTLNEQATMFPPTRLPPTFPTPPVFAFRSSGESYVIGDPHYFTFDGPKVDPQGTCAYTASKLCTNQTMSENGKHLPFFEIVVDQNWSPSGNGYGSATVVHGIEVFYRLPSVKKEDKNHDFSDIYELDQLNEEEINSTFYPKSDLYHFRIHATLSSAKRIQLNVNHGNTILLRSGENFESQGIATRRVGAFHEIYLGVGFISGNTTWLENTATTIEDYVMKIKYKFRASSYGAHGQMYLEARDVLQSKVCGLFGNFNGVNDVELPEGVDKQEWEAVLMDEYSELENSENGRK